ncbi:PACE efflux transporter [Shewanella sp. OMA3-2]|uniref:PACE efflux transporter n=1 Tax=Shewanella sp. OMA3-2 TaxID=2908650 RepID=UPI001F41BFE9|nr:PACE efflux transporter [Shewanella sp. OMA3-2]UJF22395.1 PACE efflux transporter [Shewanella sp. OMA3-2]
MNRTERIFHAIAFELIALLFIVLIAHVFSDEKANSLVVVSILLSLYTVAWNYVYNILFDKVFGHNRLDRSMMKRVIHALGFEGGIVFLSVPLIAWLLDVSLMAALALEAGFLVFFFFYAIGFNWCYDKFQPFQKLKTRLCSSR